MLEWNKAEQWLEKQGIKVGSKSEHEKEIERKSIVMERIFEQISDLNFVDVNIRFLNKA